jgi:hypothetical protein
MAVDLTDLMIRGYTTRTRKDLYDSKVMGLILRVTPSGARTWAVEYRANGRKRRYTLGPYKSEGIRGKAYTLAAARDEAETVLAKVRLGADPHVTRLGARVEARRRAQEERRLRSEGGPLTVERLVKRCLDALPLRPKTDRDVTLLRDHASPASTTGRTCCQSGRPPFQRGLVGPRMLQRGSIAAPPRSSLSVDP